MTYNTVSRVCLAGFALIALVANRRGRAEVLWSGQVSADDVSYTRGP